MRPGTVARIHTGGSVAAMPVNDVDRPDHWVEDLLRECTKRVGRSRSVVHHVMQLFVRADG